MTTNWRKVIVTHCGEEQQAVKEEGSYLQAVEFVSVGVQYTLHLLWGTHRDKPKAF